MHDHLQTLSIVTSVASRADFGFTAGATLAVMRCIVETTQLATRICHGELQSHGEVINHLHQQILACASNGSQSDHVAQLHARIFQVGTLVYFHRSILSSPPRAVVPLLDQLLGYLDAYRNHGGGYVTIWPVFIAAVEAYEERHQNGFEAWMRDCDKIGASNREDIRQFVEDIWRERQLIWRQNGMGIELGSIAINWQEVMLARGLNYLLV
jgi:Fungal specific transcription factor domain